MKQIKISLAAARVNAKMTQNDVCKALNVSMQTVVNWENGKTFPDQPMIEKICNLYGVTYDMIDFAP